MPDVLSALFAGLGLFFIGVKLIGGHLRQMTGRGVRDRIAALIDRPWRGALLGVASGALTQSTNAVTFIITSMHTAGLVDVARGAPVVVWANVGTSALVLVATVDIRLAVSILLGLIGLAYYFDIDKSARFRHVAGALLGVSLLFLGLQLIKGGALPLRDMPEVQQFLQAAGRWWAAIFFIGAVITMLVQSSGTVSAIAVTMTSTGLLTMDQTMLLIYGAGVGSAGSLWLMAANLRGVARQLALMQILLKTVAAAVLLVLLWVELGLGVPLVKAMVLSLGSNVGLQAAWIFLLFQLLGATIMSVGGTRVQQLLAHWSPPSRAEVLASPRYLYPRALEDASTALDLVEREQAGLLGFLPAYLTTAEQPAGHVTEPPAVLLPANRAVTDYVTTFLAELIDRHSDRSALDRMLNLQVRTRLLGDLRDGLHQFDELVAPLTSEANTLSAALVESLHFILTTLHTAVDTTDEHEVALLRELTADRSLIMERVRQQLVAQGSDVPIAVRTALFTASSLFERLVWIVRQYVQLLGAPAPAT
jgi:phosphate:Na+ symporter